MRPGILQSPGKSPGRKCLKAPFLPRVYSEEEVIGDQRTQIRAQITVIDR